LAVLRIVGDEVRQHGHCVRCVDEIAARAGVCRRMVQAALREAARLGLLTIEERRREGRRNLPNIVRIVSKEWTSWLARGGRASRPSAEPLIGCKKMRPTDNRNKKDPLHTSEPVIAARRQQAASAVHNRERQRYG
ncbi:MAG TPA: helix-turn-helix domain-containing protein, partial [Beijerinckiaceae bacterium]|nr:helix-turn-helix domain-containing protein [Beijerinckiaceae bacterium]